MAMFTFAEVGDFYRLSAGRCIDELSTMVLGIVEAAAVEARSYIGHPQDGWRPLSSSTIEGFRHANGRYIIGKRARGFDESEGFEPLKGDTGILKESISAEAVGLTGIVGSSDKIALYQEMGTSGRYPIPPRPMFSKALMAVEPEIEEAAGALAVSLLMPKA